MKRSNNEEVQVDRLTYRTSCQNKGNKPVSFDDVPCLVNKQYKHRTLGELVKMYRMTGELPPVGQRQGVYLADKGIDSDFPTTGDEFDDIMKARSAAKSVMDAESDLEAKIKEAVANETADKDRLISELQAKLKDVQNSQIPASQE